MDSLTMLMENKKDALNQAKEDAIRAIRENDKKGEYSKLSDTDLLQQFGYRWMWGVKISKGIKKKIYMYHHCQNELNRLEKEDCRRLHILSRYKRTMPKRYRGEDSEISIERAEKVMRDIKTYQRPGLWLYGPKGLGKTYLIHSINRRLISEGHIGAFWIGSLAEIMENSERRISFVDNCKNGSPKRSVFVDDPILNLDRFSLPKQSSLFWLFMESDNVKQFASNFTPEEMNRFDKRIAPRIREMCLVYHLTDKGLELEKGTQGVLFEKED